jgi:hypothetical protein
MRPMTTQLHEIRLTDDQIDYIELARLLSGSRALFEATVEDVFPVLRGREWKYNAEIILFEQEEEPSA